MSYAGNPSLSSDVRKRVLGTFEQTLGLAAEGSRQEALLGCDFVLRMDPHFEPARQLQERLRNSAGAVRVDDLLAPAAPAMPATTAAADPFGGGLDLPDMPDFAVPAPGGDLRARFQTLLDGRKLQELVALAQQEQATVGRDPELMRIAATAQERLEAEPYVEKFLNVAREAARQGNREEMARTMEKIRALDSSHPGLAELAGAPAPAPPAAPPAVFGATVDESPADMGFDLSLDEPDLGLGTELPDLTFDEPAATPSLMDPELVSAADFQTQIESSSDSETDRRIKQLLAEGQTAYEGGDLQDAIDAWSRIFLIDIDHREAARRIEQARKLKSESERQAEEVFHEGIAKIEAGDLEGARQTFRRVLEIQPGYFAAREYLQQLEAGQVPTTRSAARQEVSPQPALPLPSDLDLEAGGGELKEEILIPPDPSEVAAAERQRPKARPAAPVREGKARKTFVLVGSAVLVLALAGGAFVYLNKDRLFPNSQTEDPSAQSPGQGSDPIARAMDLHKGGKTPNALSVLRRVPPDDPNYQRAQQLISEWDSAAPAAAVPAQPAVLVPAGPPVNAERLALLESARSAYQGGSYLEAIERLEEAQKKGRLNPADADLLAKARRQTEPLAAQLNLVEQHEWEHALRDLWRMHEADPRNRDITRLMVDSYYNLALRDLQRMDAAQALANFREALSLQPGDEDLQRQVAFAETYQRRPKDMLYRIYVKHLPLR